MKFEEGQEIIYMARRNSCHKRIEARFIRYCTGIGENVIISYMENGHRTVKRTRVTLIEDAAARRRAEASVRAAGSVLTNTDSRNW